MNEFLLTNKNTISFSVEILAAVTGLLLLKKYELKAAKFFIYFLVYLTICDFVGNYVIYVKDGGIFSFLKDTVLSQNYWWSTLFWKIGAIMFFVFYYLKILKTTIFKRILKISGFSFFYFQLVILF